MTSYIVLYATLTGNTQKVAAAVHQQLPEPSRILLLTGESLAIPEETVFLGYWVDRGSCPEPVAQLLCQLHGKKIALFGTIGSDNQDYWPKVRQQVEKLVPADNQILGHFLCQGRMQPDVRVRYEQGLAQNPHDTRCRDGIANFDRALTHPNTADLDHAAAFARQILDQQSRAGEERQ